MGLLQRLTDLDQEGNSPLPRQSTGRVALNAGELTQCPSFNEIHDHEEEAFFCLVEVEGVDGVGVCQASDDPCLVEEACHHGGVAAELGPQHFHRHLFAENQVRGLVDRTEASLPQGLVQPIFLPQNLTREVVEDWHFNENAAVIGTALMTFSIDRVTMGAHLLGHTESLQSVG